MTNEERLEEFLPIVKRVARRIASEYHMVEAEDLEQELMMFIIQRGESIPLPSEASFSMSSFLTRVARMWAFEQKRAHYIIDPTISYEVKDIREILQTHFSHDMWDYVTEGASVEDMVAAHSDVAWALDRLSPGEKEFVAGCYTAERLPLSGTKEYRKLRDLIIKIANMCNHYTRADEGEGPGRRVVVSNSQAKALLDQDGYLANSWRV